MRHFLKAAVAALVLAVVSTSGLSAMPSSTADIIALVNHTAVLKIDRTVPNIYPHDAKSHPYVNVVKAPEGTDGGFIDTTYARRGNLGDGTKVLILPLDSGGSGGVFTTIVFAQRGNAAPWYAGYVNSGGHLDVAVSNGNIVATMPDYGAKDPNCCPSHYLQITYALRNGKLAERSRVTTVKRPTLSGVK